MRLLIGGASSKFFHLKEFGEAVSKFDIETINNQYYDRVNNIDSMINELTSEKTENLKNLTFPITELVNNSSYIDIYEN